MEFEREFEFKQKHFQIVQSLVYDYAGIHLSDAKEQLVYGRLAKRLRALGLTSFDEYTRLLADEPEKEFGNFINQITTNLTSFFRENHHFDLLASKILPELLANSSDDGRIRIWSAGCSTGEEPYSIAMSVLEQGAQFRGRDIKILATDIDTCVLDEAATGVYPLERIASLSEKRRRRWFHKGSGENAGKVKVISELKSLITFKPLNLMHTWPMPGRFDVIFCRNVLIYFDPETQTRLISRFGDYLNDKGYLFLGHSETMRDMYSRFDLLGKSGYRKVA